MTETNEVNYGPLTGLIGTWKGDSGIDLSPEREENETNPYYETITFNAAGDVENAEEQLIAAVQYTQIVQRKSNDEVFHHETGYWMWDAEAKVVMHSLVIPRGLALLAGGEYHGDQTGEIVLKVEAGADHDSWQIVQSPFMHKKAVTTAFSHELTLRGDELSYREITTLDIYGRNVKHTDRNTLVRVE